MNKALLITIILVASLSAAAAPKRVTPAPLGPMPSTPTLQVGSMQLTRCPGVPAYCGTLLRPLDPAGEVSGTIKIALQLFPHRDHSQPALETIVARRQRALTNKQKNR